MREKGLRPRYKPTSFISEHSAEFALLPALIEMLESNFGSITPIYPWLSREGSGISRWIHSQSRFKMLCVYPRRPKVSEKHGKLHITINREILAASKAAALHGVPVIAGCPIARDFWELGSKPPCCWIKLEGQSDQGYEILIDTKSLAVESPFPENIIGSEDLLSFVDLNCTKLDINEAIAAFKDMRMRSNDIGHNYYYAIFGGYKPIYLLLKERL